MATGAGQLEGYVTLDVTKLQLPTTAVTSNFTLDPQGLLYVADSTNFTAQSGAVYFANTGAGTTYSNTSDEITIINKSSYAVDVTVGVSLKNDAGEALSQIKLVDKDSLASATDPSLYFGVITNSDDPVAITADGQAIKATAEEVPLVDGSTVTDGYILKAETSDPTSDGSMTASPNGKYYYYDLTTGYTPGTDQTITFKMTGATNNVEGWKDVTEKVAAKLTYTIEKHVDAYLSATSVTSSNNVVTATLPDGVTITKVIVTKPDGSTADWTSNGNATISDATIKFKASALSSGVGRTLTVSFSDGHTEDLLIE
jgi:hypothetical protein